MANAQVIAVYNGVQYPFPAGTTPTVILNTMKAMFPELENGSFREENGQVTLFVVAQNKSAGEVIAVYNSVQYPFPAGTTPTVILNTMKAMFPELENGSFREENGQVTLFVVAQNKSAGEVIAVYNSVQYPFPTGTTPTVILNTMKAMFPELENGSFREENGQVTLFVVAQNKSVA